MGGSYTTISQAIDAWRVQREAVKKALDQIRQECRDLEEVRARKNSGAWFRGSREKTIEAAV